MIDGFWITMGLVMIFAYIIPAIFFIWFLTFLWKLFFGEVGGIPRKERKDFKSLKEGEWNSLDGADMRRRLPKMYETLLKNKIEEAKIEFGPKYESVKKELEDLWELSYDELNSLTQKDYEKDFPKLWKIMHKKEIFKEKQKIKEDEISKEEQKEIDARNKKLKAWVKKNKTRRKK
jgi:hypothetical protein